MNLELSNKSTDINTQNSEAVKDTIEPEHTHNKEDWSSLMFSSDDSLYEEWTRQMEEQETKKQNNKDPPEAALSNHHKVKTLSQTLC